MSALYVFSSSTPTKTKKVSVEQTTKHESKHTEKSEKTVEKTEKVSVSKAEKVIKPVAAVAVSAAPVAKAAAVVKSVSPPPATSSAKKSKGNASQGTSVGVAKGDADDVDLASFVAKRTAVVKKTSTVAAAVPTQATPAVISPVENVWESSAASNAAVNGGNFGDEDGGVWENPKRKKEKTSTTTTL